MSDLTQQGILYHSITYGLKRLHLVMNKKITLEGFFNKFYMAKNFYCVSGTKTFTLKKFFVCLMIIWKLHEPVLFP